MGNPGKELVQFIQVYSLAIVFNFLIL